MKQQQILDAIRAPALCTSCGRARCACTPGRARPRSSPRRHRVERHAAAGSGTPSVVRNLAVTFGDGEGAPSESDTVNELRRMHAEISNLKERLRSGGEDESGRRGRPEKKYHVCSSLFKVGEHGVTSVTRLARTASTGTREALKDALAQCAFSEVGERVTRAVAACDPASSAARPPVALADLKFLCRHAVELFRREPRLLALQSPSYVLGDLHGNLDDLAFFRDRLWPLGVRLSAGSFLFLGDYVDRGPCSVEVVAYLLAQKLAAPDKVHLLRGNHETRDVNGWEEQYGDRCLLWQCKARYGEEEGRMAWDWINRVFDCLPLAAVIDDAVFCVHGGVPRPVEGAGGADSPAALSPATPATLPSPVDLAFDEPSPEDAIAALVGRGRERERTPAEETPRARPRARTGSVASPANGDGRLSLLRAFPGVAGISPPYETENAAAVRLAMDLIWSDPVERSQRAEVDADGFAPSLRGSGLSSFSAQATEAFLRNHGLSFVIRAHQATAGGIGIGQNARVITVFSTSKDHGCGERATCGCLLVDRHRILPIARSVPARHHQRQAQAAPGAI